MNTISSQQLERWEQIAQDTKKEFFYNKHLGQWSWKSSDESGFTGFATRLDALKDAIEPYINEE